MDIHSHFGVYAVILNDAKDSILLIKKARGPYTGMLDLPGGSVETDELPDEALEREIAEETSCVTVSKEQLKTVGIRYPYFDTKRNCDRVMKHIGVLYRAEVSGTPSASGDGLDSDGAHWYKITDIENLSVTPFVKSVVENIRG